MFLCGVPARLASNPEYAGQHQPFARSSCSVALSPLASFAPSREFSQAAATPWEGTFLVPHISFVRGGFLEPVLTSRAWKLSPVANVMCPRPPPACFCWRLRVPLRASSNTSPVMPDSRLRRARANQNHRIAWTGGIEAAAPTESHYMDGWDCGYGPH